MSVAWSRACEERTGGATFDSSEEPEARPNTRKTCCSTLAWASATFVFLIHRSLAINRQLVPGSNRVESLDGYQQVELVVSTTRGQSTQSKVTRLVTIGSFGPNSQAILDVQTPSRLTGISEMFLT